MLHYTYFYLLSVICIIVKKICLNLFHDDVYMLSAHFCNIQPNQFIKDHMCFHIACLFLANLILFDLYFFLLYCPTVLILLE